MNAETMQRLKGDCVLWEGATNERGYGLTRSFGRHTTASRAAMEAHVGRKLQRLEYVCHHCDNPPCINLNHLFIGSPKANAQDMAAKGRNFRERSPETRAKLSASVAMAVAEGRLSIRRGAESPQAKLTGSAVLQIRDSAKSNRVLAAEYGVSSCLIGMVKRGEAWTHIRALTPPRRP